MQKMKIVCSVSLFLTVLVNHFCLPAFAQFGVGFGAWNWGSNNSGYGTWFGFSLSPNSRNSQSSNSQLNSSAKVNGCLEGILTVRSVCGDSNANVACPLILDEINNITISAAPYGANHWLSTRPDAHGYYRFILPPGGYNISIHHPYLEGSDKILRQIIIQSGQINRQNFKIDLPIQ